VSIERKPEALNSFKGKSNLEVTHAIYNSPAPDRRATHHFRM
jgi:hypothetical protein